MSPTRYRCAKSLVAHMALVAQWIAHWTSNPEVAGSSPVKSVYFDDWQYVNCRCSTVVSASAL